MAQRRHLRLVKITREASPVLKEVAKEKRRTIHIDLHEDSDKNPPLTKKTAQVLYLLSGWWMILQGINQSQGG
ncbi:hypothetical protein ACOSQ3_030772 [Xanthoceras sorbifolium]